MRLLSASNGPLIALIGIGICIVAFGFHLYNAKPEEELYHDFTEDPEDITAEPFYYDWRGNKTRQANEN